MDVSIIIVSFNTLRLTQNCINSIVEKTKGVDYEIIVIDNASTDGTKEVLSNDKRIKYIYSDRNGGFGYGNNLGMKHAQGKYFFLLNSDTLLLNNAIKEFYDYAEAHSSNAIYGCYLEGEDGSYRGSFHFFPAFTVRQFFHRIFHKQDYSPDYSDKDVECICGADMFVPCKVVEQVGMFDENIFLYGEEGEWQYRMAEAGIQRKIICRPRIIHLEGKSMTVSPQKRRIQRRSHFYILKKYMTLPTYWLARFYYLIRIIILELSM